MKKSISRIVTFAFAGCIALGCMIGCSQQQEQPEPETIKISEPAFDLVIGTEATENEAIIMTNETGSEITAFSYRLSGGESEYIDLNIEGGSWPNNKVAGIFFADINTASHADEDKDLSENESSNITKSATDNEANGADTATADGILLNELFEIRLTHPGGEYVIHQLNLAQLIDADDISIRTNENGTAYLEYKLNDSVANTLVFEEDIAAEMAEEAEQSNTEGAFAATGSQSADSSSASSPTPSGGTASSGSGSNSGATSSGYDTVSGGSSNASTSPSQGEDSCIDPDDLILG